MTLSNPKNCPTHIMIYKLNKLLILINIDFAKCNEFKEEIYQGRV